MTSKEKCQSINKGCRPDTGWQVAGRSCRDWPCCSAHPLAHSHQLSAGYVCEEIGEVSDIKVEQCHNAGVQMFGCADVQLYRCMGVQVYMPNL